MRKTRFSVAVYYHNGTHKAGSGSVNPIGCTVNGYPLGLWVGGNNRDSISINVESCTFNGIRKRALSIESGQSASVTGYVFNEDAMTREQLAIVLMNYAKFKGYDVSASAASWR